MSIGVGECLYKANFHCIVKNVTMLGYDVPLKWSRDKNALHIATEKLNTDKPVVFRITLE